LIELIFAISISFLSTAVFVFFVYRSGVKRKKFEEELRKYSLRMNYTIEIKPEIGVFFRLQGDSNRKKWILTSYYKALSAPGSVVRFMKLECSELRHDHTLFIGSGELHKLGDLKSLVPVNSNLLKMMMDPEVYEILPSLEKAQVNGSSEVNKAFTVLTSWNKDSSELIDGDIEKALLQIEKKRGFNVVILKDKLSIKAASPDNIQEIEQVIGIADRFIKKL